MKISIITSVYNNVSCIENAITSVFAQSYKNIEYIVIDGNSNDGTQEKIEKYRDKITKYRSEKDTGIYDALNKGIRISTGQIIGFLHSDDLFNDPYVIEKIAKYFNLYNCDAVYGDLVYVEKDNPNKILRYWKSGEYEYRKLNIGWMPPHPALFIKKSIYTKYELFNENYKIAADYDLILRFLKQNKISVKYLPEIIVRMRIGGKSNKSIKNILLKSMEDYKALKSSEVKYPLFTLAMKNIIKIPQFFNINSKILE